VFKEGLRFYNTEHNYTNLFPPFSEIHKENVEKGRLLGIFMTFGSGEGRDRRALY
jgi:hypothetical protein